jgi:lipopolysaccharide biosynthesis protein
VLRQLRLLAGQGFAVAFITMAPLLAEADRVALRQVAALVVERQNVGRDFGAWRDMMDKVAERWPHLEELMLVNDSILGPICSPQAMFAALRSGGPGLFGLTESLQGGPHMQSYLLLARGAAAVTDIAEFLAGFRPSHSKWLVVRRGELRLARWMERRGHAVAALFGYRRLIEAALADPAEVARLAASHPLLGGLAALPREARLALLEARPLNPTQHLWTTLVRRLGFPFLKTELVRRNPGSLPDVASWASLVAAEAPCPAPVIDAHLASLDAAPG